MHSHRRPPIRPSRDLLQQLRHLGDVRAPATLLPTVLARLGLGDAYASLETPIGPVFVAYNKTGVAAVMRSAGADEFEAAYRRRFGRAVRREPTLPSALARAVRQRLSGQGRPTLPVDLRGLSEFKRAVLLKALEIPRSEVRPYAWVAREIGHPRAVRAVGSALKRNPVPLLIPCHRVVRSDGRIGAYVFGEETKRAVLTTEGVEVEALEALARSGVRYYGSATTGIFCFPTCRHARRISARHRVPFGSAAEATAAGYRPCHVCRPALAS
ncbi:MAG TPA: methylated-DNA--[protein]-cysteine S-methyltransferase [Alphaproteobacteria bacterium]|nr:methylated-DNA--[protein]-cysteine S-methyltransferase [Alphaproteobacteria bacterium]